MREKMWFGVVELLEQERVIEKVELGRENMEDYYTQKELRDKEIQETSQIKYKATCEITEAGSEFIEFIELDSDSIKMIKDDKENGPTFYNALRTLWLTQYMMSI